MSQQITLTPATLAEFAKVLDTRKRVLLEGRNAYLDQAAMFCAVRAIDMLMQDNPAATGLTVMRDEVNAAEAADDGEFAGLRESIGAAA